jgi:hypothetical protein
VGFEVNIMALGWVLGRKTVLVCFKELMGYMD